LGVFDDTIKGVKNPSNVLRVIIIAELCRTDKMAEEAVIIMSSKNAVV
jgi:hypothetical protein